MSRLIHVRPRSLRYVVRDRKRVDERTYVRTSERASERARKRKNARELRVGGATKGRRSDRERRAERGREHKRAGTLCPVLSFRLPLSFSLALVISRSEHTRFSVSVAGLFQPWKFPEKIAPPTDSRFPDFFSQARERRRRRRKRRQWRRKNG